MSRDSGRSGRPTVDGRDADIEWCHEAVQGVSRTFALTVDVLDEPMASYICVGYLVCRVADTVEDAEHVPPTEQVRLLRAYDRALDPGDDADVTDFAAAVEPHVPDEPERSEDWEVVARATRIVHTFEALPADVRGAVTPPARELVQGMAMFVERYADEGGLRIGSLDELEEYCYYAAGTVGHLVTNLLVRGDVAEDRRERLYDTAEEFGLLLQFVNVAKDVYDDYTEENNVYLPAEWLVAEGVPQDEMLADEHESSAAAVVRRVADHARSFLDDAQTYLETVPTTEGNTLAAWAIPFLLAVGTLRELLARPEDALAPSGVKVSREEVFAVVSTMTDAPRRDRIEEMRRAITSEPFHRAVEPAD